jgi:hypothetical protein
MRVEIDSDVQAVLEFMQANIPCNKLAGVAESVGRVAQILWGHYDAVAVIPLVLQEKPISATQSIATE